MLEMRRDDFALEAHRSLAYADLELPLPQGQAMLFPRLEARLLQDLTVKPTDKVLEIGTGSGFMAALLGRRAQHVLSLELFPELVSLARNNLQKAGIRNVEVRQANGAEGAPNDGPFDVILLSGSVAQIPHALLNQLKVGGRLAAIVGDEPAMKATIVRRNSEAGFATTTPWDVNAPRLLNFPQASRFEF
jgi:protein-L-isoaspartate(D-aspartate) O-methyltransferase